MCGILVPNGIMSTPINVININIVSSRVEFFIELIPR